MSITICKRDKPHRTDESAHTAKDIPIPATIVAPAKCRKFVKRSVELKRCYCSKKSSFSFVKRNL